ncbi:MAG: hypothetical protein K6C13_02865 [Oscillospiraceae bacterium]|nr:hypothetical protein [Oscillospiraceae bacterium]
MIACNEIFFTEAAYYTDTSITDVAANGRDKILSAVRMPFLKQRKRKEDKPNEL